MDVTTNETINDSDRSVVAEQNAVKRRRIRIHVVIDNHKHTKIGRIVTLTVSILKNLRKSQSEALSSSLITTHTHTLSCMHAADGQMSGAV